MMIGFVTWPPFCTIMIVQKGGQVTKQTWPPFCTIMIVQKGGQVTKQTWPPFCTIMIVQKGGQMTKPIIRGGGTGPRRPGNCRTKVTETETHNSKFFAVKHTDSFN